MPRRALLLLFLSALWLPGSVRAIQHLWSRNYDNPVVLSDIAIDSDANTIIVADYFGTPDLGSGPFPDGYIYPNFCVAKYNAAGEHVWSRGFGSTSGPQQSGSVATDSQGNIFVAGRFESTLDLGGGPLQGMAYGGDIYLAKLAPDGTHIWSTSFTDSTNSSHAADIAIDSEDNVILSGDFCCSIDYGGGTLDTEHDIDVFLAKFDGDGNHLWSQIFPGSENQGASCVSVDSDDNIILAGSMAGDVDFGGGTLYSVGGAEMFLAKFDSGGGHVWSQNFGGADVDLKVAVDPSDNVIFVGDFESSADFGGGVLNSVGLRDIFVAKFNSSGSHLWSKRFGDANDQAASDVTVDTFGYICVGGAGSGVLDFGGGPVETPSPVDGYLFQLDELGNHVWSQGFGPSDATALASGPVGNIALGGIFSDDIDIGGGPLVHAGGSNNIFFGRFSTTATAAPAGAPVFAPNLRAYPNPFNPAIEISFELATAGRVSVRIYDSVGRQVAVLIDEQFLPAGTQQMVWGDPLPSGVYYVQLQSESASVSKKITLLK